MELAEQAMTYFYDGLKVMVIDDSKTIRRTAETLLRKVEIGRAHV